MKKYLILSLAVASLYSCSDRLDILPEDSLSPAAVFSDAPGAEAAVNGLYSFAQSADALNGTFQLAQEWQADNVDFVGSFPTLQEINIYETKADNTSIFPFYDQHYNVIGTANLVIENIPGVPDPTFTQARKDQLVGEAKFMRALMYFELADFFGQPFQQGGRANLSVQLVTVINGDPAPQRATLGEIHDQVETDLMEAIPVLSNSDNSRATKGAAQALLARLYLYQERFPEAATMANNALSNAEFSLAPNYLFYNTLSGEHFFTLVNSSVNPQPAQGYNSLLNPIPAGGRGDAPFSQNLIDAYNSEPGDLRFANLNQTGPSAAANAIRTFSSKFPDGTSNGDNATVLRYTEALLTRAEANFRAGSSVGATPLADITRLRTRAGLGPIAVTLSQILIERRKELAFEGQRRMDLLRNGLSLRRAGMAKVSESAAGSPLTILPIPAREVELSQLTQNTGY
ncbi:RagB/SusD family nutrient uptake outer membrane protein [Nonlabens antarcticus]|uniref:RagB/SusD family nutrient uptake outer membrane protein n=1 Tax=Nonlabens antarcticus TaxID=392714 RepID=UPI001891F1E0|nr:RagB/SusD family nutrient uptake outer membrane protein [Nonlabens antarcticus]